MYIDYSSWETFEYKVNTLELDKKNPRFDHLEIELNQTQIIKHLINNEKVYELAKKISEEGYFVGEEPIICVENGKKIVLEGNRRVAALKLLNEPNKYLSSSKARVLNANIAKYDYPIERKVKCYIAPNRLQANPIIYERHNGSTLHRWETGNQYAFVAKMYYEDGLEIDDICEILNETRGAILKPLKAYNLFHEAKSIFEKEEQSTVDSKSFSFTNLERFYSYDRAKKFLGFDFDNSDASLNITIPREEFENRLLCIFKRILNSDNFSRDFNNDNQKEEYIKALEQNPEFDMTVKNIDSQKGISTSERNKVEDSKTQITTRRRRKSITKSFFTSIIPRETIIVFGVEKLDILFSELRSLTPDKVYSFALLLRTYLDQSIYIYLEKKNLLEDAGLKAREKKKADNEAKVKQLLEYLEGKNPGITQSINEGNIMNLLKFNVNNEYVDSSLKTSLDYIKKHVLPQNITDKMELKNLNHYIDRVKDGLDLAVHNPTTIVDIEHNKRAWLALEPIFTILSTELTNV